LGKKFRAAACALQSPKAENKTVRLHGEVIGRCRKKFQPKFSRRETNLAALRTLGFITRARAHGMWTYEPRQGRKAATVVCSASAVVTLAFFGSFTVCDLRFMIWRQRWLRLQAGAQS
jgi:hypothetical protein